ncbi:hypothetical protein GRF29_216g1204451 [Pseudopithomyces chartarum]|uniref:DUF8021 domain-containing protein n=1 Tax=Pseudopithomyces chartarum TaxID=1892770 RepID=A0AAN6RCP6_9PLEO|nr:hypothetical protein GRF29_216g1204451 [Pseudopithomyces chartarum]
MLPLLLLLPTLTSAACPRSTLTTATSALLQAYTSGTPSLLPLTPNTTYYENDTPVSLSTSLLSTPLSIAHNLSLHDTTLCATATELITSSSAPHPYVLLTRLQFSSDGEKVVKVESVVADKGDWLFDAGKALGAKNRRYVIDEDLGAVAILNDFPFLDKTKPNGTSSTNILRVEGGQIRYIHEITVCSTANCGR